VRGNIRKRGAGSWLLQIELERHGRKRRRRFVTVKGSRRDAERELTKLQAAADTGTLAGDPTNMTVGEYITASIAARVDLSPRTRERYEELINKYQITPYLGSIKLQKLRPEHLEAWHAALIKKGFSAHTVGPAHRLLKRTLNRAVENGALSPNVAAIRKPPKPEEKEIEILMPDQIAPVLEALKGHLNSRGDRTRAPAKKTIAPITMSAKLRGSSSQQASSGNSNST
jgi:hypothetical protein